MNWGTRILLGMFAFMLFIVAMVVYMFHVHGRDALIEENYYEKGINFNVEYNARQNVFHDQAKPKITITKNQVIIQVKHSAKYHLVLMRPANSADDLKLSGKTVGNTNLILVDKTKMAKGMWFIALSWQVNGKEYLFKDNITL